MSGLDIIKTFIAVFVTAHFWTKPNYPAVGNWLNN